MLMSSLKYAAAVVVTAILLSSAAPRAKAEGPTAKSPDGKIEATADDQVIVLLDSASGKIRAKMNGHTGKVTALAFSPDGKTLASGGVDKSVRFWDAATGKEIRPSL